MARSVVEKCRLGIIAGFVTPFEAQLMQRFCRLQHLSWLTLFFQAASRMGDWPLWVAVALAGLTLGETAARLAVAAAAVAVTASVLLFTAAKNLFGRPRPYETCSLVPCLLAPPDRFSFPSGHTMTAFAVQSAFAAFLPATAAPLLVIALVIGFSRVYLGCHYPSDVLAGGLLGWLIGMGAVAAVVACLS